MSAHPKTVYALSPVVFVHSHSGKAFEIISTTDLAFWGAFYMESAFETISTIILRACTRSSAEQFKKQKSG